MGVTYTVYPARSRSIAAAAASAVESTIRLWASPRVLEYRVIGIRSSALASESATPVGPTYAATKPIAAKAAKTPSTPRRRDHFGVGDFALRVGEITAFSSGLTRS